MNRCSTVPCSARGRTETHVMRGRTMHGGHGLGACDHDLVVAGLRRRVRRGRIESGVGAVLAEPGARLVLQARLAVVADDAVVRRRAEKHEVLLAEPRQQRITIGDAQHPVAHLVEVVDDADDLTDRGGHVGFELAPRAQPCTDRARSASTPRPSGRHRPHRRRPRRRRRRRTRHPVVRVAGDREHRVDEQVDAEVVAVEHHPHRVDEERDVVGDEHQHRALGAPPVTVGLRREHPHQDLAGRADPSEDQVGDRSGVCVVEPAIVGVLVGELAVVADEELRQDVIVGSPLVRHVGQRGERLGDLGMCTHASSNRPRRRARSTEPDSTAWRGLAVDGWLRHLPALEFGRPLLEVAGEPLAEVLGGEEGEQREVLPLHVVLEILGHRMAHHPLRGTDGERCVRGDLAGELHRGVHQLVGGHHVVDEADI